MLQSLSHDRSTHTASALELSSLLCSTRSGERAAKSRRPRLSMARDCLFCLGSRAEQLWRSERSVVRNNRTFLYIYVNSMALNAGLLHTDSRLSPANRQHNKCVKNSILVKGFEAIAFGGSSIGHKSSFSIPRWTATWAF